MSAKRPKRKFRGWVHRRCSPGGIRREKKIRGWKRREKIISWWREEYIPSLDLSILEETGHDYERVLHPWDVFVGSYRQPPTGYRNQLLAGLLDIYDAWDRQLKEKGKNNLIQIWLYDRQFFESSVEIFSVDRNEWIVPSCFIPVKKQIPFPAFRFLESADRLQNFRWTCHFYTDSDPADPNPKDLPDPQRQDYVWVVTKR